MLDEALKVIDLIGNFRNKFKNKNISDVLKVDEV